MKTRKMDSKWKLKSKIGNRREKTKPIIWKNRKSRKIMSKTRNKNKPIITSNKIEKISKVIRKNQHI